MRVLNTKVLESYMAKHARCRGPVRAWLSETRMAEWASPAELKERYPGASILSGNRVVFDLAGNNYRLVCVVAYRTSVVVVERIGTHAEYDKWDL